MKQKVDHTFKINGTIIFMGLFLLITPFVYSELVLDPVLLPRTVFLSVLNFFFLIFLIYQILKKKAKASILNSALTRVFLIYILLSGVSVILSINPGEGIWKFLKGFLLFILFTGFSVSFNNPKKLLRPLALIFQVFSVIILSRGIVQLVEVISAGPLNHESSYIINSWFAHRNLFAQILLFTLPFLGFAAYTFRKGLRISALFLMAISLVMITILLVKSVWLALIVAVIFCFILLIVFRKRFGLSVAAFRKTGIYFISGVFVILISIAVYSRFETIETFEKQTYVLKNYRFGSALERVHLWEKSLEMFKESPIIGIGMANWNIYLPKYGTHEMRSAEGEIIYQRPHNDFLWVLSENGIITFIFYALTFLIVLFYQVQIIRRTEDRNIRFFTLALFFFMISYGVVAFFSFPSERSMHSLLLMIVFALTLSFHQSVKIKAKPVKPGQDIKLPGLFLLVTVLIIYIGIRKLSSEYHTRAALQYRMDILWQKVVDEVDKADDFFTKLDPTATPLRWYSGLSWYNLGDMDKAKADFEMAYAANPYHMHVLNNLGTIYGIHGDYRKAVGFFREAVEISPNFTDAVINLASSLFNINEIDTAYQVFRNGVDVKQHPNYQKVLTTLVYRKIENLKKKVDDRDLELTLTRIRNSNEWMVKVHQQAVYDKIPLEKHLFIEAIYVMEKVDNKIDSNRAKYLKDKYLREN
jgi:O-antigen ligase/Tfp pilus assembly protein PilF